MRFTISGLAAGMVLGSGALYAASVQAQSNAVAADKQVVQVAGMTSVPAAGFEASFAGKSIAPTDSIFLVFASAVNATDGQFAVIVGTEDVTANFRWVSPTRLEGVFAAMPLPEGSNLLRVYRISAGNQWVEIAQIPISVAPAQAGTKASVYRPSLIVGVKSQLAETHTDNAQPPVRPTYADLTLQGGLQTEHGGSDWSVRSQFNVAGSSYRPEAVNFVSRGDDAPKVDVTTYLIDSTFNSGVGTTALSMGQVQAGTHPLLANGIGNRGVVLSQKFGNRVDLVAALQNATPTLGATNILGVNDAEHRLATATAGVELLERAGGFRLEASSFRGAVKPQLAAGIATLQDAEESRGWGLRAQSRSQEGSLRADLAFAHSDFTSLGNVATNVAPMPTTSGDSWYADLAYDLIKGAQIANNYPLSVTAQARHEYSTATYKSLGSPQAANYVSDTLGLNASLGMLVSQLQLGNRSDNVDSAAAFLVNRAQTVNFMLAAPLGQMIDSAQPPAWAPTLSYTQGRNHNLADTSHIPLGQTLADLPDVMVTTRGLGLNWMVGRFNFGYQYSRNLQDNNQPGLELNDMLDVGHTVMMSYQVSESLSLNGGAARRKSEQRDSGLERYNNTAQAGLNWRFGDRYAFITNVTASHDRDSSFSSDNETLLAQFQLNKQFNLVSFGTKLPGQWSLSYSDSQFNSMGIGIRYKTFNAALSLSFF